MSTTHDWPITDLDFTLERFDLGVVAKGAESIAPYTGASSYGEVPFAVRRTVTIMWPSQSWAVRQKIVGWLYKVRRPNLARIPILTAPVPLGTMRGSPTVTGTATRGTAAIAITPTSGTTLKMGDYFGLTTTTAGQQVVCATADATLPGSVPFDPPLRGNVNVGTPVLWDKPWVTWVMVGDWKDPRKGSEAEPLAIDFEEFWSA